jgi:hypothetical protein
VDLGTIYTTEARLDKGLVVILPGIEGEGAANHDIRKGLYDAGVPCALAIYRWGYPIPGIGLLVNQTDVAGNRRAGAKLAGRILTYQQKRPGRPVYLIGHSGGGGVAVFALESLAGVGQPVEGAFLLSASLSSNYLMDQALQMTRRGIVNVSNPQDKLLDSGTAVFGNVDGGHGASAGRAGFSRSYPRLFERRVTGASLGVAGSPHFVATNAAVIAKRAPAWLNSAKWPPPGLVR